MPRCAPVTPEANCVRADELLHSARATEVSLRALAADIAIQITAAGKTDAIESVTGANSLARAAAEVSEMIRSLEAEIKRGGKSGASVSPSSQERKT